MKSFLIVSIILLVCLNSQAQDPTFTQFYANPVYLNPALAGSHGCPRLASNYRNEWPQLTGN
ncbi:MAG: type IX secretion system membrane protein PorP/SprF, partial [Bacteroidota bacterium]